MNTIQYPVVSQNEVIDLFHAVLFWRYLEKQKKGINPCFWYTTFSLVEKVLTMANVLHERRIATLQGNRDFFKAFLAKTAVVQQTDNRDWESILNGIKDRPFAVKISPREQVNGNRVDPKELFSLKKIFITARGIAAGQVVERVVAKFLTHTAYEVIWQEITAVHVPGVALAMRQKRYAAWLAGEEEKMV